MFTIKFTMRVGNRSVSVAFKTKKYERAIQLVQQHRQDAVRVYKGEIPTNLHTIRG